MFYRADGKMYEGDWANGKQHGRGTYTNQKGETKECEWREGKKVNEGASKGAGAGASKGAGAKKGTAKGSPGKKGKKSAV